MVLPVLQGFIGLDSVLPVFYRISRRCLDFSGLLKRLYSISLVRTIVYSLLMGFSGLYRVSRYFSRFHRIFVQLYRLSLVWTKYYGLFMGLTEFYEDLQG